MSLLFLLLPTMARSQDLATKKINLNIGHLSIDAALSEIQQQSGIKFVYGEDINKYASKQVTIASNSISVKDALVRTLNGTNLQYTQEGNRVMIYEKPASQPTQPAKGKGIRHRP